MLTYDMLQPCTARDFMDYLKYVEIAAENLQFFLWYKDYCKRFDQLDGAEKALAPEWTAAQADAETTAAQSQATNQGKQHEVLAVLKGTMFAPDAKNPRGGESAGDPFATPPRADSQSDLGGTGLSAIWEVSSVEITPGQSEDYAKSAAGAFDKANLNWQPCKLLSYK
jgi:hypothetical protein